MTIIGACGFEAYDGNTVYNQFDVLTGTNPINATASRWSGGRGLDTINGEHGVRFAVPASDTYWFSVAIQPQTILALQRSIMSFRLGGEIQVDVVLVDQGSSTAKLTFWRGSAAPGKGGTSLVTQSTAFDWSVWNTISVKLVVHASAGAITLALNENIVDTWTSLNTNGSSKGTDITQLCTYGGLSKSGGVGGNWRVYYDDCYWGDSFEGVYRMALVDTSSDGTYSEWTPSTGTDHEALIDERPENTTDGNSSATLNQRDTFNTNAVGVTGTVKFVNVILAMARTSGDAYREVAPMMRLSGTDLVGPSLAVPDSEEWCERFNGLFFTKPGGGAWTVSDVDSAELIGYKLVT